MRKDKNMFPNRYIKDIRQKFSPTGTPLDIEMLVVTNKPAETPFNGYVISEEWVPILNYMNYNELNENIKEF